jgi:D-tyrosyl-tRNA(Tyr) deacylase
MRAVFQRVSQARVEVEGRTVGAIDQGLLILLGVAQGDDEAAARRLAAKAAKLRLFESPTKASHFDLDVREVGGAALVVSQFTLHADASKGRRPSFSLAARPEAAEPLYHVFCTALEEEGVPVQKGLFGALMAVHLVNQGPVTIILDSA